MVSLIEFLHTKLSLKQTEAQGLKGLTVHYIDVRGAWKRVRRQKQKVFRIRLILKTAGFLVVAGHTLASLLAVSPLTPPRVRAESTCSNGDERPPVGRFAGANTNCLPSKPCLTCASRCYWRWLFCSLALPGVKEGASAWPLHIKVWRRTQNNEHFQRRAKVLCVCLCECKCVQSEESMIYEGKKWVGPLIWIVDINAYVLWVWIRRAENWLTMSSHSHTFAHNSIHTVLYIQYCASQ